MKTKLDMIFYHGNCSDGLLAAYIAKQHLEKDMESEIPAYPLEHNTINVSSLKDFQKKLDKLFGQNTIDFNQVKCLYILDINLKNPVYLELLEQYPNLSIVIIDHHKTSQEEIAELSNIIHEQHKTKRIKPYFHLGFSGAGLSYLYFARPNVMAEIMLMGHDISTEQLKEIKQSMPIQVQCVQDRDIWTWEVPETKHFMAYYINNIKSFKDCKQYIGNFETNPELLQNQLLIGKSLSDMFDNQIETMLNTNGHDEITFKINGKLHKGYIINSSPMFSSELGSRLCRLDEEHKFAITWMTNYNSKREPYCKCSIRSTNDYDCSIIAKHFGGGGHAQASGFGATFKQLHLHEPIPSNHIIDLDKE